MMMSYPINMSRFKPFYIILFSLITLFSCKKKSKLTDVIASNPTEIVRDSIIENPFFFAEKLSNAAISIIDKDNIPTYTLKAGINWQFRLGRFDELDKIGYDIVDEGKTIIYKSKDRLSELFYNGIMFRKYSFPETIFVCRDGLRWILFRSDDIVKYIVSNIRVRILATGRIKIDLLDQTSEKYRAIFTLEYRSENHKRSFVFGAHGGGAGKKLQNILMNNCDHDFLDLFITSAR